MTITKSEILDELRELAAAVQIVDITVSTMGAKYVTKAQLESLGKSYDRAAKFLKDLDGPKIETECICWDKTPGRSMMDKPCPLHAIECDRCDGCGWYEGGKTLQTKCEDCGGRGHVYNKPQEQRETK